MFFHSPQKIQQVLIEAGYVPSNSEKYPFGGIISAIQNAFHATPEVQCRGGAVEELHLCFYKDFTVRAFFLCNICMLPLLIKCQSFLQN